MVKLTGMTPTPRQFADAWAEQFGDVVRQAGGRDGRLSQAEARRIAKRDAPDFLASDNAVNFFKATGQKTVSVEKFIRVASEYVEREASAVAGSNQKLSLLEARCLPKDLKDDFMFLRGKGLPERRTWAELGEEVAEFVHTAFADWSWETLPRPPWQVRGERPIVDSFSHPDDPNTRAYVYVAQDTIYVSIGKTANASSDTPEVGWYNLGPVPAE